ncbi:FeoA family protein [Petroclostridium sp. X23]|uniref:FeoA family protein n=1 Tax=Petroclostridium sp. X23 TaxID=3045146 RepID=UPI0024AE863C|nr:FeoA family protein [Petroclostridium sp. X23]WHH59966.1 FeoA family protein [Petroclostridium sp. X23]
MKIVNNKLAKTSVNDLKRGHRGIIAELDTNNKSILRKLMSMGILPGIEIRIIQTFPSYVVEAGYTQVAIDKDIAAAIVVDLHN